MDAKTVARFWAKVDKTPGHGRDGDCWVWTGSKDHHGYGQFSFNLRPRKAHRIAYQLHTGHAPGGLCVLHCCDNPPCVNPDHLSLGTKQDNSSQMIARGRSATGDRNGSRTHPERVARGDRNGSRTHPERLNPPRGSQAWNAKLSEDDVRKIRRRYAAGGVSFRSLARVYGVGKTTIEKLIKRESWAHVPEGVI